MNYIEKGDEINILMLALKDDNDREDICYLDTKANNHMHMCGKQSFFFFFVDIGKIVNGEVTLDDFSKNPVKGRRKVFIHLKYGENKFVSNMYYVPNMKK